MRKFFILLAASVICFACKSGSGETNSSGTPITIASKELIGNLYYAIHKDYTAEVVPSSTHYDMLNGALIIPSSVEYNGKTYTVTSIGTDAFRECRGITSVAIPNTVTKIDHEAFYKCEKLAYISLPKSVTNIGDGVFIGTALSEPIYTKHIFAYLPASYTGKYVIPHGIRKIAGGAFYQCKSLTSVIIPNTVNDIGFEAFKSCKNLTSAAIPSSVTNIGPWAFSRCKSLTSITIPSSVTHIGQCAFSDCINLTSITIPSSVTYISDDAFDGCPNLQIKYAE